MIAMSDVRICCTHGVSFQLLHLHVAVGPLFFLFFFLFFFISSSSSYYFYLILLLLSLSRLSVFRYSQCLWIVFLTRRAGLLPRVLCARGLLRFSTTPAIPGQWPCRASHQIWLASRRLLWLPSRPVERCVSCGVRLHSPPYRPEGSLFNSLPIFSYAKVSLFGRSLLIAAEIAQHAELMGEMLGVCYFT